MYNLVVISKTKKGYDRLWNLKYRRELFQLAEKYNQNSQNTKYLLKKIHKNYHSTEQKMHEKSKPQIFYDFQHLCY